MEHKVTKGKHYYYIHWKGYSAEDDSWEPRENIIPETLKSWEDSIKTRRMTQNSQDPRSSRNPQNPRNLRTPNLAP